MATPITITKFSRALADFVNLVNYRGESFILLKGKKPVAEIRPVAKAFSLNDLSELFRTNKNLSQEESNSYLEDIKKIKEESSKDKGKDKWE